MVKLKIFVSVSLSAAVLFVLFFNPAYGDTGTAASRARAVHAARGGR